MLLKKRLRLYSAGFSKLTVKDASKLRQELSQKGVYFCGEEDPIRQAL